MRVFNVLLIVLVAASCVPVDVGGCPLEPLEAIGKPCPQDGVQCGEASLCDRCVSDGSQCESVQCKDGRWTELEWPATCADAGMN